MGGSPPWNRRTKTAASEKPKAEDHHQNKELQGVLWWKYKKPAQQSVGKSHQNELRKKSWDMLKLGIWSGFSKKSQTFSGIWCILMSWCHISIHFHVFSASGLGPRSPLPFQRWWSSASQSIPRRLKGFLESQQSSMKGEFYGLWRLYLYYIMWIYILYIYIYMMYNIYIYIYIIYIYSWCSA